MRARVHIIDNRTGQPVEAELFDEVTVEHFIETQQEWRPIVLKAARQLACVVAASSFLSIITGTGLRRPRSLVYLPTAFMASGMKTNCKG